MPRMGTFHLHHFMCVQARLWCVQVHSVRAAFCSHAAAGLCRHISIPTNSHACRHDYSVRNYVAAAQHLATAQQEGLCRHIGVTNFDVPRLKEMLDAGVRIVSNQA